MQSVKLDFSRLLGFKIMARDATASLSRSVPAAKIGGKLGVKLGVKVGSKPIR